jgi:acyl-coenzyme A synthetase/AMP-(fatty) acid ligase
MRQSHLKGYRFHEQAWASYEELEGYGQTEAPAFAMDCAALGVEHRLGKLGKPGPGHEFRVIDPRDVRTCRSGSSRRDRPGV